MSDKDRNAQNPKDWSRAVAELAADALIDGEVIAAEQSDRATEIIAEEIWARLLVRDYPSIDF